MDEQDEILKKLLEFLEKNPITLNVNPEFSYEQTLMLIQAFSICKMREILLLKYDITHFQIKELYRSLGLNLSCINIENSLPSDISKTH
jgi:hypothetical protein